jgi:hypothetical protein
MPRRKRGSVSLARGATAGRALPPDHQDATPERLCRAREAGASAIVEAPGLRRIVEPFDLLRSRGLLDRGDAGLNDLLWQAGDRMRQHLHLACLDSLSALDLTRPSVDGGGGGGSSSPSEAALRHREAFRRAAEAVGPRLMPYVTAVALEGKPIAAVRDLVGETGHARTAEALALERLREGLHRLCDVWGLRGRSRPGPSAAA